ncbi:hypothetical protein SAMN04488570_1687 [Nocardioides scoriae]|uniref:Uncharacterized protein n=1 Tax=Nocardioides scoriae TaxID=642780 RepID=A0A1H1RJB7_9ACTN|nr:hypothetical protein [Nocardioides scoriae]SDS35059.1 hypothetical protein SAMN04488570_1687 [Nocardioides scoriae]
MAGTGRTSGRAGPLLVALLLLLAGCADGPADGSSGATSPRPSAHRTVTAHAAPVPPGLGLSFVQQRFDEGTRRAGVRVSNGTGRDLHVVAVGVEWAGYPLRLHRTAYDVGARSVVDLRYLLPAATCTSAAGAAPISAVARVRQDGRVRTVRRPMDEEGTRFLTRLWRTDCAARRIAAAATVSFDDRWRLDAAEPTGLGATLRGSLLLDRRRGTTPVVVDQVQGSVLFELAVPTGADERTLAPGARRARVPLEVHPGRCDEHGRSQSTQTFVWRVWLRLGGSEPLARVVIPTQEQQDRLLAFLDRACG